MRKPGEIRTSVDPPATEIKRPASDRLILMIDIDTPLADCGIDSVLGMTLCADLECEKGFSVETTIVWDYPTIDALAAHLAAERAVP